ncbi:MAG TPA: O-antigen ligase family protein [Candidatus Sulfotelmatobacter sp.]|nr:O-antigen ligase family protein [Candidatus Sulfotelmatobacter sp.]
MALLRRRKMTAEVNRQSRSAQLSIVLLYGTWGVLLFGPLAFGAVEPWSIFIVQASAVLLCGIWLAKQWLDGEISILWNPLFLPMASFAALIVLQIIFSHTVYRHETLSQLILYSAYGMLCFLASQSLLRASQARKIAVAVAVYGVIIAVFALIEGVAPNGKLYWLRQPRWGGWIYGPYVNHNHYAGLMELLVPVPLVISLSHLAHDKARIAAGIAAAIMVGTVFLSGSRGGMLGICIELAVLGSVLLKQKRGMRVAFGLGAFAIVLISLLVWLGGKELTTRVTSISTEARGEISGGMRLSIDRDTLKMFRRRPVLGWGLGTFPVVYPEFRTFYTNFFVNEAHNDYLQLLAEMGLLGFATMAWFLVVLYRQALRKIDKWPSDVSGALTLACSLGAIGILIHSLVDFNLQIPANAALFYVLCTLAAAPRLLQRSKKRRPVPTEDDAELVPASEAS